MRRHVRFESLERRQLMSFGQPVDDFGVAGRASVVFAQGNADPAEMLIDGSGRVLTASDAGLARLTAAGQPDTTFGSGGTTALTSLSVRDVAFDSSGRIVVLAFGASGSLLLRFTANGVKDSSFGTNGAALVTSRRSFSPRALAVQSDGKFVVAGTIKTTDENFNDSFTTRVYRQLATGAADLGFDADGAADFQLGPQDLLHPLPKDTVLDVAAVNNRIVVAGGSQVFSPSGSDPETGNFFPASYGDAQLVAAALTDGGALETGWGSGGFARALAETGNQITPATAGKVFSDGLIGIATEDARQRMFVARFNSSGALVRQTRGARQFHIQTPRDIALLPDGRFAIAGSGGFNRTAVVTLNAASEFGPIVRPLAENGDELTETDHVQIATAGEDLMLGGQWWFNSNQQRFEKLDGGTALEKPNQFPSGTVSDLVIDTTGAVHLAYYDSTARRLMYAQRDRQGLWKTAVAIDGHPLAGQQLSIDVEPGTNRPAIAYYDGTSADLKLAQWNGRRWAYTTLDSNGTTGQYPSIEFGPARNLSVAYYDRTRMDAKFVTRENGAWVYQTIESAGDVGRYMDIEYTPQSQRPSVTYTSATGVLKYAVRGATGAWTVTDVLTIAGAGPAYLSMDYGGFGNRGAISFYDAQNADLRLAWFDGAAWKTKTLATVGAQGLYTRVYAPIDSNLFVFAYNRSKDRFSVYTTTTDTGTPTTESVLDTAYGRNLAVAIGPDGDFVAAAFDSLTQNLNVTEGLVS